MPLDTSSATTWNLQPTLCGYFERKLMFFVSTLGGTLSRLSNDVADIRPFLLGDPLKQPTLCVFLSAGSFEVNKVKKVKK